jgi:primosomal protein N' (replication factor Y)
MDILWQALLTSPPYASLTYRLPVHFPPPWPGQRVLVPVGRGLRAAVLESRARAVPEGVALKDLLWPLDREPLLDAQWLDMARNLAARQMSPLGRILEVLLPRGLRTGQLTFSLADRLGGRFPAHLPPRALRDMGPEDLAALMGLWRSGNMRVRVQPAKEARERLVTLACDPPWPVRPNARKRIEILDLLLAEGPQSLEALARLLGPGAPALGHPHPHRPGGPGHGLHRAALYPRNHHRRHRRHRRHDQELPPPGRAHPAPGARHPWHRLGLHHRHGRQRGT